MGIKDVYELANRINTMKSVFENTRTLHSVAEYAQKLTLPYISEYCSRVSSKTNMLKKMYTPSIIKMAQNQLRISQMILPQLENLNKRQKMLEGITPQLALVSEAMKPYLELKNKFAKYNIVSINEKLAQLSEIYIKQSLNSILLKDYWIIMDENLFNELKEHCSDDKFDANKLIVRYYSKNKFSNIKIVLDQIKSADCLEDKQIEILEDCYAAMKKLSYKIACNTVIPTLTAQADGLLFVICEIIPAEIKETIMKENNIQKYSFAAIISAYLETLAVYDTAEKFKQVIKKKAFGKSQKNDSYQKSRHKILHGSCDYGTKENLVRCWLEIAFLIKVYCLIAALQNKKEAA